MELQVIIHDIRSIHNVGAILRTCDGFGVKKVYIGGTSPYPKIDGDRRLPHIIERQTNAIAKTALGAEQTLVIEHYDDINDLIAACKRQGVVVALEQSDASQPLSSFASPKKALTLLLGSEVMGVDPQLLKEMDAILEIPMYGSKESFNVSVACGIALYALTSVPTA